MYIVLFTSTIVVVDLRHSQWGFMKVWGPQISENTILTKLQVILKYDLCASDNIYGHKYDSYKYNETQTL